MCHRQPQCLLSLRFRLLEAITRGERASSHQVDVCRDFWRCPVVIEMLSHREQKTVSTKRIEGRRNRGTCSVGVHAEGRTYGGISLLYNKPLKCLSPWERWREFVEEVFDLRVVFFYGCVLKARSEPLCRSMLDKTPPSSTR